MCVCGGGGGGGIEPDKQNQIQHKIVMIFLSIISNMFFWCSKERSHGDGSFEYPQHMFWLRNKKIIFSYTLLSGGLGGLDLPLSKFTPSSAHQQNTIEMVLRLRANGGLLCLLAIGFLRKLETDPSPSL